jgi:hypothetical protein
MIAAGDQKLIATAPGTGDWAAFRVAEVGTITLADSNEVKVTVRPQDATSWRPLNLRWIRLARQ